MRGEPGIPATSNITLRQIEAFLAVARERKFAAAAERLHVSAPYLSQTIKQLEHALGYILLTRTTRTVELTPAGDVFAGLAERALADLERAIAGRARDRSAAPDQPATRLHDRRGTRPRPHPAAHLRRRISRYPGPDRGIRLRRTQRRATRSPCPRGSHPTPHRPGGPAHRRPGPRGSASPAFPRVMNSPAGKPSPSPTCFPSRSSRPRRRSARGATTGSSLSTAPPPRPS